MKAARLLFFVVSLTAMVMAVWCVLDRVASNPPAAVGKFPENQHVKTIRLGVVPEHDVYALRKSYQGLAAYLSQELGCNVNIVNLNSYDAVLSDFEDRQIDGAFLGALVAVLAIDQHGATVIAKPETADGVSTYRGVLFVRGDSPIKDWEDLCGRSIATVRTTYAGSIYPVAELRRRNLIHCDNPPRFVYLGTHDDVIAAVASGKVDAGAAKDLRIAVWQKRNPDPSLRWVSVSTPVPNNVLVLRGDVAREIGPALAGALLGMDQSEAGRKALASLGIARFVPCHVDEYKAVCELSAVIADAWDHTGVREPAPAMMRPATSPGAAP